MFFAHDQDWGMTFLCPYLSLESSVIFLCPVQLRRGIELLGGQLASNYGHLTTDHQ